MKKYFSATMMLRLVMVLVVFLALAAGYFSAALAAEKNKYLRLEDKFVRVRQALGREETQRLIDESY